MVKFNRNTTTSGKITKVQVNNGLFIDYETGEVLDVARIFETIYGNNVFDISVKLAEKEELDVVIDEDGDQAD